MLRSLFLSKAVLALVGLVPVLFGELALLHGNCAADCAGAVRAGASAESLPVPDLADADCIVYEAASGRLVTVKAPADGRASHCAEL